MEAAPPPPRSAAQSDRPVMLFLLCQSGALEVGKQLHLTALPRLL